MGKRDKRKKAKKKGRGADRGAGPSPAKLAPPPLRIEPAGPYRWRVRRSGDMRVHGLIFGDESTLAAVRRDQGAQQVANVATLPGIVGHAIAMPDIHWGYGFPIGGVAAFDAEDGVVSPGGIGYDINCGVRLISTGLSAGEVGPRLEAMIDALHAAVPAGLGRARPGASLDDDTLDRVLAAGAPAAIGMGFGDPGDLERVEEGGALESADPAAVSDKARARGAGQLGTLGSGNHFVEIQRVESILEPDTAQAFGLSQGQLVLMIHTGSRGLGHQVCTDAVATMGRAARDAGIALPDRQLACAPLGSKAATSYLAAMAAAANFAFANRQVLGHLALEALARALELSPEALGGRVVYDVCHNIAKLETHLVDGARRRVLVHRKGATRALGPGDPRLPASLRGVGQPVLVPGDMGRASWVLVGTEQAAAESFSSSCHGAGRKLSRSAALRAAKGRDLAAELEKSGVLTRAASRKTLLEEMPQAYKNVDEVIEIVRGAGLCRAVARLVPLAVVKG